jgi:hypothetical protein
VPASTRHIRCDKRQHHAEHGGADAIEHLHRHKQVRRADACEEDCPYRQGAETEDQHGPASPLLRLTSDPRRQRRHDELRHDDARRDHQLHVVAHVRGHFAGSQIEHGRVREVKQHHACGEDQQPLVLQQVTQGFALFAFRGEFGLARRRTRHDGRRIVVNHPQRDDGGKRERGRQEKHRTQRQIFAERAHQRSSQCAADRCPSRVAAEPVAEIGA